MQNQWPKCYKIVDFLYSEPIYTQIKSSESVFRDNLGC